MNTNYETTSSNRTAAINGLAVVGFVALVAGGMWLAVYSAQFVPAAVSRLGAAAVALTQIFNPAPSGGLSVIPTASTTLPFGNATSTATSTGTTPSTGTTKPTPTAGTQTSTTEPIGGTNSATLFGLSDLEVTISTVGYLASSDPNSFVAGTKVPSGARPAVKFTIRNVGTNASGAWKFSASIPTKRSFVYKSASQQNLNPGESIDYTLGFDDAQRGTNQEITLTADYEDKISESNEKNNSAVAAVTIL